MCSVIAVSETLRIWSGNRRVEKGTHPGLLALPSLLNGGGVMTINDDQISIALGKCNVLGKICDIFNL